MINKNNIGHINNNNNNNILTMKKTEIKINEIVSKQIQLPQLK